MESASVVKELALTALNQTALVSPFVLDMDFARVFRASASRGGLVSTAEPRDARWYQIAQDTDTALRVFAFVKKAGRETFAISRRLVLAIATTEVFASEESATAEAVMEEMHVSTKNAQEAARGTESV